MLVLGIEPATSGTNRLAQNERDSNQLSYIPVLKKEGSTPSVKVSLGLYMVAIYCIVKCLYVNRGVLGTF